MKTKKIAAHQLSEGHKILINGRVKTVIEINWTHAYLKSEEPFAATTSIPKNNDLVDLIL